MVSSEMFVAARTNFINIVSKIEADGSLTTVIRRSDFESNRFHLTMIPKGLLKPFDKLTDPINFINHYENVILGYGGSYGDCVFYYFDILFKDYHHDTMCKAAKLKPSYIDLRTGEERNKTDFELWNDLKKIYFSKTLTTLYKLKSLRKFSELTQGDLSVREYASQYRFLRNRLKFLNIYKMTTIDCCKKFISHLNNNDLVLELMTLDLDSLDSVISYAIDYEESN
eukprot:NODE_156_length_15158_cov_0.791553.p6 type:complete len:226 gc:universal NODE_156_length_15158_cov_0.791553:13497-12820(-)